MESNNNKQPQAHGYGEQTGGLPEAGVARVGKMGKRGYDKVQLPAVK